MAVKRDVCIAIDSKGSTLRIWLLPKARTDDTPPPLVDLSDDLDRDATLEPIQLLENTEYGYAFQLAEPATAFNTDRPEVFEADDPDGLRGRLRPGLYTGRLPVIIRDGDRELGRVAFEVRSRKFDYLSHYRWMLRDIADGFAEVIMERFAPTEQSFEVDHTRDAATLYQRFAFLKALLQGERFDAAIQHILARPHRAWVTEEITRAPGQGIRATSRVLRQIRQPGRRTAWDEGPVDSLPARLQVPQTEETVDTPENRFAKFALTRWRDVVATIGRILEEEQASQPVVRGRAEVAQLVDHLDALLSADLFTEVGELVHFPASSQVLQKRAGYRDIFRAYVQFEAAARLSWTGGEDVYGAGQRDVATLYEYWVFLQLAEAVSRLCQEPLDRHTLLDNRADGLIIGLKQGRRKVMSGVINRLGRSLRLELWYNRSFNLGNGIAASWTRPMRPDYSLLIRPEKGSPGFEEIWLHFDAKYRVENIAGLFGGNAAPDTDEETAFLDSERAAERRGAPKRTDLLKMHAYRDAIRRSAGAYVLYPGTEVEKRPLYHEILPGLGAFSLRPSESGEADGIHSVQRFIDEVLTHVASQVTQHERGRYWEREVYREENRVDVVAPVAPFVLRPPADTLVLLGYVKDKEHLGWIHEKRLYNLRADGVSSGSVGLGSRELAFDLVLLYGPGVDGVEIWPSIGEPELVTREGMVELGYPNPRRALYYCARLADPVPAELVTRSSRGQLEAVRRLVKPGAVEGAPVVTSWAELVTGG
ncbi:MAG TPA: DUF2357 domain-containing protein [Symbiobacteriaceae bacterium]|nr:DUF2357 domain-containing protein [Symbiobacteriaceae bacterium]